MTLGIEEVLFPGLGDRSIRFVFPSEICAEDWLARSLAQGGAGALEIDRFLGWDRLKEKAAQKEGRLPVDDYLRRIFAANCLAGNADHPFLSSILPPAYAGEWQPFASYLASRLPALGRLPAALDAAGQAALEDPTALDWLSVRERYESFLRETGRFEPSYEPRTLRDLDGLTILFFPELIEDFDEYRPALEACPSVRLVGLPDIGKGNAAGMDAPARLRRPETALAELRGTLSEIGRLLDDGVEASDIAITVAGLESYRPYLEREASLLSVPIALRSGRSLAATPGGRLFTALRDAYSSGFSYDSLRDLLLSPAWPWRNPETGRAIVTEGRRLHAVASWPEDGKTVDAWERSLSGSLAAEYRKLKSRITAIASAEDFPRLLRSYNAFRSEFLAPAHEEWDEATDLTLARCVVELEGLVHAQDESGLDAPGAFGLFMRALESKPYVSARAGGGVPVYDWRVAAGIRPEHHFILNASQDDLVVPLRGFDFLGEALRRRLGAALYHDPDAADRDCAPDFIRAYALSGDSVTFSCPETGLDGEKAVHGFLVSLSTEEDAVSVDPAYREEAAWLAERGPEPRRRYRAQAAGLDAAAAAGRVVSGTGAFLSPPTALAASARLTRRGRDGVERPSIDSTAIDYYHSCPYAYLYLRLLGAGPAPSGITFVDALFLGDVYHEALALLFEGIRETDGRFRADRLDAYRNMVGPCLGQAFERLSRTRGPFVAVVLEVYRGRLETYLAALLDAEAERFAGLEVGPIEADLELEYPDLPGGLMLRGRIDRISRSGRGAVVIDYKKGKIPERRSVAPDEAGSIAEAQIPCYLRLVSASGEELDSAWYVSIEGHDRRLPGQAVCAFGEPDKGEPYISREGLEPFLAAFDAALRSTVQGIAAGSFALADRDLQKEVCRDCGARGICRERYALRFGTESVQPAPADAESRA
jgi:hypothetical protein